MTKEKTMDYKIISVNRRTYPKQLGSTDEWDYSPPTIVTVLVLGNVGDYAAYIGIGSPEWIARFGAKLMFEEAKIHFPTIEREKYRGY